DHQQVAPDQAWAALARDLVAAGHVDDVDRVVGQAPAEGQRQVVAAALDEGHLGTREPRRERFERRQVHRRVLADGRVRAGAGFDADDAIGVEDARERPPDVLGVLGGHDVVGDDDRLDSTAEQAWNELLDQGGLAGADWATDTDTERYVTGWSTS